MKASFVSGVALVSLLALPAGAGEYKDAKQQPGASTAPTQQPASQQAQSPASAAQKPNLVGTFEVLAVAGDAIAVLMNGMVVELTLSEATLFNGMKAQGAQDMQSRVRNDFKVGDLIVVKAKRAPGEKDNLALAIEKAPMSPGTTGSAIDTTIGSDPFARTDPSDDPRAPSTSPPNTGSVSGSDPLDDEADMPSGANDTSGRIPTTAEERARAAEEFPAAPVKVTATVIGVDGMDLVVDVGGFAVDLAFDNDSVINGVAAQPTGFAARLARDFKVGARVSVEIERDDASNHVRVLNKM